MSQNTTRREPPAAATKAQIDAADPDRAVFVSANAGSGKTHVLVQRVVNLLLRGEDPAKILCITFTKAAAANMAARVFETLAQWTALDDAALDDKIRNSTGKPSDPTQRARARRLFAHALETPGGLKVQTIHAFCTRLLHQFPFEADVAARFEVLDETTTAKLLNDLTLGVILEGAADPDGALGQALASAITAAADITFKEVIAETIRKRDLVTAWVERAGGVPQAIAELTRAFRLDPNDSIAAVGEEYFSVSLIPQSEWPALMQVLTAGDKKSDRDLADVLLAAQRTRGRESVEHYQQIFCTAKLEPRKNVVTANFTKANPDWAARLAEEHDRVCRLVAREFALRARDRSAALITIASAVIERYRAEKERRGLLDYEDLIGKTLALFKKTSAAWVLYKLDLGIDHVLVDEAQDTSPQQWDIISTLVSEFVQAGARPEEKRTIFAVGDEKQSIFSFQGAAPRAFAEMRDHFRRLYQHSDVPFAVEKLHYSFRSAAEVLDAVDTVFRQPQAFRGLTTEDVWTVHQALPDAAPGEVEIWDLVAPDEKDKGKEGWDAPFDTASETSPAIKLAARVARTVKGWVAQGTRPREVLILVRQRGPFFEAVIRALKREAIDVAGADRLILTEHIAIMDLLVLADALLLPDDDLALATVLKSPLFGLNDDQLYTLAYARKARLRSVLRAKAGEDPMFASASRGLDDLAAKARVLAPFEFYAHVLGARRGRAQFLARLGIEASDPIDEFLNLALVYEQRETPSLQGFVAWVRAAQSEVKRDMEMARDEVRVMTVHGAKGLEAKNVILVDTTTTRPEGAYPPRLLIAHLPNAPASAEGIIWGVAKDKDAGPMAEARIRAIEAAKDEYRRLLYVGLTRAAERLVMCGTKGINKIPDGCWYELVLGALRPRSTEVDTADGKVWQFRKIERGAAEAAITSPPAKAALPAWLRGDAAPEPAAMRSVTPSSAFDDEAARPAASGGAGAARLRGVLAHRLLQSLPDIPADRRARAADEYLARAGAKLPAEDRKLVAEHVMRVIEDSRFSELYGAGSRAEVPVVGRVDIDDESIRVSGQIDRLAVTQDTIFIADFKTNANPPQRIAEVPPGYVRQLALYRAVLAKLYPGKSIRAALVWTEAADIMELSADAMDAALAHVTPA
jgi:ATP-dependent helicase/nuclease subunit A